MIDAFEIPSRNGRYLFQRGPAATVSAAAHTAQLGRPPGAPDAPGAAFVPGVLRPGRGGVAPLFIIDSHPVDVCRPVRAGRKERLGGLVQHGYCASLKRWFHGVREHLVFTPGGRIAFVLQAPGNRHDVRGLYGLRKTTFRGHLVGDNAYWPKGSKREALARRGITVTAATRSNWKVQNTAEEQAMLKQWRGKVERRIGLFDRQFHAGRTLCRSHRHYEARRWFKVLSHNLSRHLNRKRRRPAESVAHFRLAA